jgi:hypothetical protein
MLALSQAYTRTVFPIRMHAQTWVASLDGWLALEWLFGRSEGIDSPLLGMAALTPTEK